MSCLYSIDEKMGNFSSEIYHQDFGFNNSELNHANARLLFSKNSKARTKAKENLLKSLNYQSDLIEVVPDDFCIIPKSIITELQFPDISIKNDQSSYEATSQVLKTMDRTNVEVVKKVLIHLDVMMNSREVYQKSHDDDLWVFFMTSLDMGFPNNDVIRKLTINILYKWVVCVPSFRIYLANEPTVLEFLINTLIYFQEDAQVKRHASWLLFLLLFVNFIVTTERSISMPQFLDFMRCPYKFNLHWTESPFNKITALEQLQEMMEATTDTNKVFDISQKHMKFTFALQWFNGPFSLDNFSSDSYYRDKSPKTFKVIEKLQLTEADIKIIKHSHYSDFFRELGHQLDNFDVVLHRQSLIYAMKFLIKANSLHRQLIA
jgi:hypothetical protein